MTDPRLDEALDRIRRSTEQAIKRALSREIRKASRSPSRILLPPQL
jgi:hypothetical protein